MRTLLLAMTEENHDKRSWSRSAIVALFLLLTLVLNASSREQAALVREIFSTTTTTTNSNNSNDNNNDHALLLFTILVTLAQVVVPATLITAENSRGELPSKEALVVILVSHSAVTFLQDYLAGLGGPEASVAAAFLEPLFALITVWIVTSTRSGINSWGGCSLVVLGSTLMSVSMKTVLQSERTSLIRLLVAFSSILRNIVLRQLTSVENTTVKFRKSRYVIGVWSLGVVSVVWAVAIGANLWIAPLVCSLMSVTVSTALLYVTSLISRNFSVVSISLFHTWALLIEALILTSVDHRPKLVIGVLALGVVVIGHFVYFKDLLENNSNNGLAVYHKKPVNTHEQYTRVEFLLFFSFVIGVVFYVLQPRVSQRDLKTLSYVGLDKVVRRLLSIGKDVS